MSAEKKRRRFTLRIHPAGLVMLCLAFFFAPSELVLAAALALLWHEGAHMLAMTLARTDGCTIELTPFGGMADVRCYERISPGAQAAIAASGVLASAAGAYLCVRYAPHTGFWYAFGNCHFSLALINCLPVFPLDGARVLMALASHFGVERFFVKAMLFLAYLLGAALVMLALYGAWMGHVNLTLLLLGPYLCYAAHESAISQNVRSMQRVQGAREKLEKGGALPVRAIACAIEPEGVQLMRLLGRMPPQCFHMLYVINPESGTVEKTITEAQMAGKLFS